MALKNKRGQGSLEYLIIVAAVLAIAAVVVLFLSGAFSSTKSSGDLASCKNQASNCAASLIGTASGTLCNGTNVCIACSATVAKSTNTAVYANATYACQNGKPDFIIAA